MAAVVESLLTVDDFLALPEEGMDRELIRGELREKPMTVRNRFHSSTMGRVVRVLGNWASSQADPPEILSGEAGFILPGDPPSVFGIDVAVVSPQTMAEQTDDTSLIRGIPLLAVEILSPSDTVESIHEKEQAYEEAGVPLVWVIDPLDRTVKVREPGQPPQLFNEQQQLTAEPHLPGFQVPVKELFGAK